MAVEPSISEILASVRRCIPENLAPPVGEPPAPGPHVGYSECGPLTRWAVDCRASAFEPEFESEFWSWRIITDLSIGMVARRKAWPTQWYLAMGSNDTLIIKKERRVGEAWVPTQADLLNADWIIGD